MPYRFASTSATETAYARYRPDISAASIRFTPGLAPDPRAISLNFARITREARRRWRSTIAVWATGPCTSAPIAAGSAEGYVDISNRSSQSGRVVIADMIGRILAGVCPGWLVKRREAACTGSNGTLTTRGIYSEYLQCRAMELSVSLRYAEYMNRESDGSLGRGRSSIFHLSPRPGALPEALGAVQRQQHPVVGTPNQFQLANTLAREVNLDLVVQTRPQLGQPYHRDTRSIEHPVWRNQQLVRAKRV